jgi:hypothetical protein
MAVLIGKNMPADRKRADSYQNLMNVSKTGSKRILKETHFILQKNNQNNVFFAIKRLRRECHLIISYNDTIY